MSTQQNVTVMAQRRGEVVLEERSIPEPKRDEFLIKTKRTLISIGTELTTLSGEFSPDSVWARFGSNFPRPFGYSNIGKVINVGRDVKKHWIGKTVATYKGGYHAQYVIGKPENSCRVPQNIKDDHATFFVLARTAMNGVRRGRVQWGETVAIYGLGVLGQLATRFCYIAGARPVVGLDISRQRLKYLHGLQGIVGINPNTHEFLDHMKNLTKGHLFDVVFEVTGNPDIIPQEFEILKTQGRFVVLSSPRGKTLFDFHDLCNFPSYSIIGAHSSSHPQALIPDNPWTKKRHTELFFELITDGRLNIESLITHRENYEKAPEIYKMLLKDRSQALGIVLKW